VRGADGRAVQVNPIKPTLKAPGTKRLTLKYDELLSSCAFNFNLHRYMTGAESGALPRLRRLSLQGCEAGAYTRSLFRST